MKKLISAILVFCIFISVGGYMVPCTLHCLNMESNMEMTHHEAKSNADCEGSCTIHTVTDDNADQQDTVPSKDMLLTQYRVNLTAADTISGDLFIDSFLVETYLKSWPSALFSSWIPDPIVPPPQSLLSA